MSLKFKVKKLKTIVNICQLSKLIKLINILNSFIFFFTAGPPSTESSGTGKSIIAKRLHFNSVGIDTLLSKMKVTLYTTSEAKHLKFTNNCTVML